LCYQCGDRHLDGATFESVLSDEIPRRADELDALCASLDWRRQ
jgi:hypothetical protein